MGIYIIIYTVYIYIYLSVYIDEGMTIPQYGYVKKNTYSELHINALATHI